MERNRINSNVAKVEAHLKCALGRWIASRKDHLTREELRFLANVVSSDFNSLPVNESFHALCTSGICKECCRRGISAKEFPFLFKRWGKKILNERLPENPAYDQAPVMADQAFMNIAYLLSGISDETSFAFLGDDDFHSLLLAKLLPKLLITVFEADSRVGSKISEIASREGLNISVVHVDMRDGINSAYYEQFNAFYTDPPYSESGILLFLYWGIMLLAKSQCSWGVVAAPFTILPLAVREVLRKVQGYLIDNGFLIEDALPFFKQSPHALGIISGIMKFRRIELYDIKAPPITQNIYRHFYA